VTHNDGWTLQLLDDRFVVIGHFGHAEVIDLRSVVSQRFDVTVHAGPALGNHVESAVLAVVEPELPAE
jgi:hypothetical protein